MKKHITNTGVIWNEYWLYYFRMWILKVVYVGFVIFWVSKLWNKN